MNYAVNLMEKNLGKNNWFFSYPFVCFYVIIKYNGSWKSKLYHKKYYSFLMWYFLNVHVHNVTNKTSKRKLKSGLDYSRRVMLMWKIHLRDYTCDNVESRRRLYFYYIF
jgi:hypothetical protein